MAQTQRGAFIVFEGIDRCGKSTQSGLLVSKLKAQGVPCEHMRFPDRTTVIGKLINDYLTNVSDTEDHTIHLLFSANRWEKRDAILRLLKSGTTIVCDRYAYSGAVYTASKGLDLAWCKSSDKGLPRPDLVIYLELSVEEAQKRGQYGEERYEKEAFQRKATENYSKLREVNWKVVDATLPSESITEIIETLAYVTVTESAALPLREDLWL